MLSWDFPALSLLLPVWPQNVFTNFQTQLKTDFRILPLIIFSLLKSLLEVVVAELTFLLISNRTHVKNIVWNENKIQVQFLEVTEQYS